MFSFRSATTTSLLLNFEYLFSRSALYGTHQIIISLFTQHFMHFYWFMKFKLPSSQENNCIHILWVKLVTVMVYIWIRVLFQIISIWFCFFHLKLTMPNPGQRFMAILTTSTTITFNKCKTNKSLPLAQSTNIDVSSLIQHILWKIGMVMLVGNKWAKHGNEETEGTICITERMC